MIKNTLNTNNLLYIFTNLTEILAPYINGNQKSNNTNKTITVLDKSLAFIGGEKKAN